MFETLSDGVTEQVAQNFQNIDIKSSDTEDFVEEKYQININQKIDELSSDSCVYYHALNTETNQQFFAIAFDRSFNPNIAKIFLFKAKNRPFFVNPVAISYAKLSNDKIKRLIVIVPKYDYTNNLAAIFDKIGQQNSGYIVGTLLPVLVNIIQFAEDNNLNIGNINPENLIFLDDKLTLREPYTNYSHSKQPYHYLAPEIMDAHYSGRKTNSTAADIFAVGVTLINTYYGNLLLSEATESFKEERLNVGTFAGLCGKRRVGDDVKNQFKGCLTDNAIERWKLRNLMDWQIGKPTKSKIALSSSATDTFAPVSFNGKNYSNYKSLASALYNNWDIALNFLGEDRVLKWIQRGTGKTKIIDNLDELVSREYASQGFTKSFIDREERLMKAIQILDCQGPFRCDDFSSHLTSISSFFFWAYVSNKKNIIDIFIKVTLKKFWEDFKKYELDFDFDESSIDKISEIPEFYNIYIPGCAVERVLYYLNPNLPCLSPIVFNDHITSLKDLLIQLDRLAATSSEKNLFDKHIISFIASKINLKRDIYNNLLKEIPIQSDATFVHGLVVIVLAMQSIEEQIELSNLASTLGKKATEFINMTINNVKVRRSLEEGISNAADESDLQTILKLISNSKLYQKDQSGFYKATKDVKSINKRIQALANNKDVTHYGTIFGQRITVLVSYLLFMIIMFFTVV
jgi:eukaryotic-like serine/threonine-protein kinase